MSCGQACDGCNERAQHHLCPACATEDIDNLKKQLQEAREDAHKHREDALAWMQVSFAHQRERDEARAEVEMLRGVGCGELREGAKIEDGPCGACLKCARRERDAATEELIAASREIEQIKAERDKARAEVERLRDQAEKNAAAHRADRERLDEALTAETHAWAAVRAMRHELARFDDTAREWGTELGKAMKELREARAEIDRLLKANNQPEQVNE